MGQQGKEIPPQVSTHRILSVGANGFLPSRNYETIRIITEYKLICLVGLKFLKSSPKLLIFSYFVRVRMDSRWRNEGSIVPLHKLTTHCSEKRNI
uniref:Uncharacterized protein n=1 Tax=Lepeophtheirus salmonis TaxID=72036 RepID=A0A0K2V256_LEPSM